MLWAILIAVLVVGAIGFRLMWMVSGLKQLCLTLYDMLVELNEADREILLGVDRIEDKLGMVKPDKKET